MHLILIKYSRYKLYNWGHVNISNRTRIELQKDSSRVTWLTPHKSQPNKPLLYCVFQIKIHLRFDYVVALLSLFIYIFFFFNCCTLDSETNIRPIKKVSNYIFFNNFLAEFSFSKNPNFFFSSKINKRSDKFIPESRVCHLWSDLKPEIQCKMDFRTRAGLL